jgi:uroporphyrinogen decarboxylase
MNSAERFFTAMRGEVPDRVPIFELWVHPKIIDAMVPGASWPDFVESEGLDAISSLWIFDGTIKEERIDERTTIDEWGVKWRYGEEDRAPIEGPIKSMEDAKHFIPPDPHAPHRLAVVKEYIKQFKGKKAVVWEQRSDFMWAADLRGLTNFLVDFLDNPKLAHEVLDIVNDFAIAIARDAVRAGVDVVMYGDDLAFGTGPMMSPEAYREFILPRFKRAVDAVKEEGAFCVKHSDGNIWKLLDMMVDTGIDGVHSLEPIANMDIGEVKRKYGDRICLLGNIDCGELLSRGTVQDVERTVKETIRAAAPGGGYIISSSNTIHSAVKPENYKAMLDATRRYGEYPIEVG